LLMYRLLLFFFLSGFIASCGRQPDMSEEQPVREQLQPEAIVSVEKNEDSYEVESIGSAIPQYFQDSVVVTRELFLKVGTLVPLGTDLPVARNDSFAGVERYVSRINIPLPMKYSKPLRSISLSIDNDIFTNTDYYYTHGTSISVTGIGNRLYRALPGLGFYGDDSYEMSLHQNLFTPINPESGDLVPEDRPFAGLLFFRFTKHSVLHKSKIQLKSEWVIGVIGPSSLGEKIQQSIHELQPTGWTYQVQDDLLLNLNLELEKGIMVYENFEFAASAGINAGSMNTGALVSGKIIAGKLHPRNKSYQQSYSGEQKRTKTIHYQFSFKPSVQYVMHNASLNGGWINTLSQHTFARSEIKPMVASVQAGLCISYAEWDLNMYLNYISSEFNGGFDHRWGGIGITYFVQ